MPLKGVLVTEQDVARFLREARAAAGLQHPNICPVHEIDAHGKYPLIVMALIQGQTLSAMIRDRKGPISIKQAAQIVRKLAQALEVAHAKGIIHRDLKSANVMFDRERKDVVIMDFGLARRTASGDANQTQDGTQIGSPAYMSPEQARGDVKAVGPLSDQYSLGVILYELLTGRLPFTGTVNEVLGKVQFVEPEPPSKHRPGLDPALEGICLQALAKDPARRFGSMRDLADALGSWLKDAPATSPAALAPAAHPAGPAADTVDALGAKMETLAEQQKQHTATAVAEGLKQSARRTWRILLFVGVPVAVLLLVVTAVVVFLASQGPGYVDNSVTVNLFNIPYLDDAGVVFVLDGNTVSAKKLSGPIQLQVGPHELLIKRGDQVVEVRNFHVRPGDANGKVAVPIPEPEGKPGELAKWVVEDGNSSSPGTGVAYSPDGRHVLAAGCFTQNGGFRAGNVLMWDLTESEKEPKTFALALAGKVAFDPRGGGRAALMSNRDAGVIPNPVIQFWDTEKWRDRHLIKADGGIATFLQYSSDGEKILASWDSARTYVWESDTGKEVLQLPLAPALFAPDGKHLFHVTENDKTTLQLVEMVGTTVVRTYRGHSSPISTLACSRDGKYVAAGTGGPANAVRVWDVATGAEVQVFIGNTQGVSALAISPDNRRVLSGGVETRLWNIDDGKLVHTFGPPSGVGDVCFSPGGRRAAFALRDGTVRVWQLPP